jgi:DNA-binding LytR/AlgR family response regulator
MSTEPPAPGSFPVPIRLGARIVGWLAADVAALAAGLSAPTPDAPPSRLLLVPAAPDILAVRTGRRGFTIVPQVQIVYVTSTGGVTTVYADGGRFWSDLTLTEIERRLDPRRFFRLDQSHLVNVARIAELIPEPHQRYRLVFADQAKSELVLSRDVGRRLRAALGW